MEAFTFSIYTKDGDRIPLRAWELKEERVSRTGEKRFYRWVEVPNTLAWLAEGDLLLYYDCYIEYVSTPEPNRDRLLSDFTNLGVLFVQGAVFGWDVVQNATLHWKDYKKEIAIHKWLGDRTIADVRPALVASRKGMCQLCKADLLAFYIHRYEEDGPAACSTPDDAIESGCFRFPYDNKIVHSVYEEIVIERFLDTDKVLNHSRKPDALSLVDASLAAVRQHLETAGKREGWLTVREQKMTEQKMTLTAPKDPRVFIVHGHDEAKRRELVDLLTRRLGLETVVMQEQPGKSRTFIEKFEQEASSCNAAIAVVTPDDTVTHGDDAYQQPRQNVVYELGWFGGKWGRNRTLLVVKEGVKVPTDWLGIEQLRFRNDIEEVFFKLEREIKEWRSSPAPPNAPASRAHPPFSDTGRLRAPVEVLVQPRIYAKAQGEQAFEYAVEMSDLQDKGATRSDLRLLVECGYVEHLRAWSVPGVSKRGFAKIGGSAFEHDSCFVLTDEGWRWADSTFGLGPT
jgi:predicted nucleotide-binding protein